MKLFCSVVALTLTLGSRSNRAAHAVVVRLCTLSVRNVTAESQADGEGQEPFYLIATCYLFWLLEHWLVWNRERVDQPTRKSFNNSNETAAFSIDPELVLQQAVP